MLDQVAYLKSIGLNAAAVYNGQEEAVLRDIEEGFYSHIYATPESYAQHKVMAKYASDPIFQRSLCPICSRRSSLHQSMVSCLLNQ